MNYLPIIPAALSAIFVTLAAATQHPLYMTLAVLANWVTVAILIYNHRDDQRRN